MGMEGESINQRVVLIHDASGGVRTNAVRWIIDGFSLKPGDMFTFLSVLHEIHHPSMFDSFQILTSKLVHLLLSDLVLVGYKIRVDGSMFGANQKAIDKELERRKKEYKDNLELVQISKLYEMHEVTEGNFVFLSLG
ncbi:hypothetical protein Ccrd_012327 [Cynara cardunculus var. scolymus]|uniref:Uncharacterized protein n=1 Tax=Cynara cardunculus var. scolymus TaxID=59895 RepID=A0A103YHP1_CYNCS|nr:hypothetical protein Ccrd_012327 [Cynara cardunculus var. scolymus]